MLDENEDGAPSRTYNLLETGAIFGEENLHQDTGGPPLLRRLFGGRTAPAKGQYAYFF